MARDSKTTTAAYLRKAQGEITAWENARRGYFLRFGDFVFNPAAAWTARMIPKSVQTAATFTIEQTLLLSARVGTLGIDQKSLDRERAEKLGRKRTLVPRLKASDALARKHWRNHCGYAAAQGAATGLTGLPGFIAEFPLLLTTALRSIRTIGLCYGYSARTPQEKNYILHVLRAGSTTLPEVRAESLAILKRLEAESRGASARTRDKDTRVHYLLTIDQYAKSLAMDLLRRNALQLIPIAGAVTGATLNAAYLNDIGRAAYVCYRRRFIDDSATPEDNRKAPARRKKTV